MFGGDAPPQGVVVASGVRAPASNTPAVCGAVLGLFAVCLVLTPAWWAAWPVVVVGWRDAHTGLDLARRGAPGRAHAALAVVLHALALATLTGVTFALISLNA